MIVAEATVATRQAQVLGQPLRVAPRAQSELQGEARELATAIGATLGVVGSPELPTYFAVMFRHPGLYRCQMELGIEMFARGALPPAERELAILRTAWLCGAPYEWSEHVALAHKQGWTEADTERVTQGSSAPGWTAHQRALLRAVEELHADHMIADETWAALAQSWDERQLIELPALVGQYITVALVQNSLRMPLGTDRGGLHAR